MSSVNRVIIIGGGNVGLAGQFIDSYTEELARLQTKHPSDFDMSGIQITDEQKEALLSVGLVFEEFKEFVDKMIKATMGTTETLRDSSYALRNLIEPQPEKDYTQKHKPWKKDKFYY
jgi:hypothetical protein